MADLTDDYKKKLTEIASYVIDNIKKTEPPLSTPIKLSNEASNDYNKKMMGIVSYVINELKKDPSISSTKSSDDYNKKLTEIASYVIDELKKTPSPDVTDNLKKIIPDILGKIKELSKNTPLIEDSANVAKENIINTPLIEESVNVAKDITIPPFSHTLKDDVMNVMWKLQNNILTNEKGQNMDIELAIDNKKSKYNTIRKIERLLATFKKKVKQNKTTKAKISGKIVFNNKKEAPKITTEIPSNQP